MKEINTVSIYLIKDNKILLIYRNKKKNDINHHKYIGVGGHIEEGESPLEAIIREVKEETSLDVIKPNLRALVTFYFDDFIEHMYLYSSSNFQGTLSDCNEGTLEWVEINNLPHIPMWEGDKYFIYPILNGDPYFEISMKYEGDKLISYQKN